MWPFATERSPAKPSFRKSQNFQVSLPNCELSFSAPKTDHILGARLSDYSSEDSLVDSFVDQECANGTVANRFVSLIGLTWDMRGAPIVSSSVGSVGVSIRLVETHWLGVNESLFDPNVLIDCLHKEFSAISQGESFVLGPESNIELNDYYVPKTLDMLRCQWTLLAGMPALYKESISLRDAVNDIEYILPLGEKRYLRVAGHMWRNVDNAGNYVRADQRVPLKPFIEVVDEVVKSLSIVPSKDLNEKFDYLSRSLVQSAPRLSPSKEYVYLAKSALKRSSAFSFRAKPNQPEEISAIEASNLVDTLLTLRDLPNPFGFDGPVTYVHHQGDLSPVPLSFRKEVPPPG